MNLFYCLFLTFLLSPVLATQAKISGTAKNFIEYQWPKDGDKYVPQRTTFIIRPSKSFIENRSASDFSFTVYGEISGGHLGKVIISDDHQTVIFKPDLPFALDESVSVKLTITGLENA